MCNLMASVNEETTVASVMGTILIFVYFREVAKNFCKNDRGAGIEPSPFGLLPVSMNEMVGI
jgi:hypothetical protein